MSLVLTDQRPLELRLSCVNSWPVAQKAVHTASDAQVLPKSNNNKKKRGAGGGGTRPLAGSGGTRRIFSIGSAGIELWAELIITADRGEFASIGRLFIVLCIYRNW